MFSFLQTQLRGTMYLTLGVILGYVFATTLNRNSTQTVEYISQEEILGFEKERLKAIEEPEQKQLFFGHPKLAAKLIEESALSYRKENAQVVFSNGKVYGRSVKSISKDIYDEVMQQLKENNTTTKDSESGTDDLEDND